MATEDLRINIKELQCDRQRLSGLVFEPLQAIKDFVARNLRLDEVDHIVSLLRNAIRSDTLRTVTDGEALIAVLNLYYGKDNLRVVLRLLQKINCHDLLQVVSDWDSSNNPVHPRVFQECGYFPLWIRIRNHFAWFSENKKTILQKIRRLFQIPEIAQGDPGWETVIYMGVSFGASDLLVYVLVPECSRKHVRSSLGRTDVCLTMQQLSIIGIYFGRKTRRNGYGDDLSLTSFTSMNESFQGDLIQNHEDQQISNHSKATGEIKNGCYNGKQEQNQSSLGSPNFSQSVLSPERGNAKVVLANMGYIDTAAPENRTDLPIRVVRPKIMYIHHNVQAAMDVEDSPMKVKAIPDKVHCVHDQSIVKERPNIIGDNPQRFKDDTLSQRSSPVQLDRHHWKKYREPILANERLIVPEVKQSKELQSWSIPDELFSTTQDNTTSDSHGDWSLNISLKNENGQKLEDNERAESSKKRTSVVDFSFEDSYVNGERSWYSQSPSKKSHTGTAAVNYGNMAAKSEVIPLKRTTSKLENTKKFTSTATFQVSGRHGHKNFQKEPVGFLNGKIYKTEALPSFNMSQSDFDDRRVVTKSNQRIQRQSEPGSTWYEDAVLEDSLYRSMIPEPEPEDTRQFYLDEDCYQGNMKPQEETATPIIYSARTTDGRAHTPIYSPPESFRDAPVSGKLVMVKTTLVDQPRHQPSIVSRGHDNMVQHDREDSQRDTEIQREFPKATGFTSDGFYKPSDHSSREYNQYNDYRPKNLHEHSQQFLALKAESEVLSDYDDSVFTDHEYRDDTSGRFAVVPPPYVPPPEYKKILRKLDGKSNDDSISTDTHRSDHVHKSPLLSAASISSIYKEKEMFLSREELQMSIKGAEDKEVEKQMELCKDLMVAAKAGDEDEAKRTIDEGVDMNYQNEFGQSAMMVASWEGHLGIVEALLNDGADPNLQDGYGKTALHEAAISGQHAIVHRLIPGGANVNLADEEKRTPLHYAAMRGKRRIVEVLLLFGANVSLLTKDGESAIELAYWYRHDDIVALLQSTGDKRTRREMDSLIRKQKIRSAASLPNLSKASSMKELSRARSRPDLRKKKSVCPIQ